MSETPRSGKKDQRVTREALDDIVEETPEGRTQPQYRNPNREQSRGDWDRSGRHHDEEA
jgi:hypothetical protein